MTHPRTELTGKALVRNEKAQRNKTRKMTYKGRPPKAERPKSRLQGRGFQKPPDGYKHQWPTRKVGQ